MEQKEKLEFYLQKIQALGKQKIGVTELLQLINISRTTFQTIIKENNLHLLPQFTTKSYKLRNGNTRQIYKFDVYDVAQFLSEN